MSMGKGAKPQKRKGARCQGKGKKGRRRRKGGSAFFIRGEKVTEDYIAMKKDKKKCSPQKKKPEHSGDRRKGRGIEEGEDLRERPGLKFMTTGGHTTQEGRERTKSGGEGSKPKGKKKDTPHRKDDRGRRISITRKGVISGRGGTNGWNGSANNRCTGYT